MIPDVESGLTFQSFSDIIRSVVADVHDEQLGDGDIFRLFSLFDVDADGSLSDAEANALNHTLIQAINALRYALIVVDFQNDFVSGSLAIKKGSAHQDPLEALIPLNALLTRAADFHEVIYTLDWHPINHISFYEHCRNSDRSLSRKDKQRKLKPFDVVSFEQPKCKQVLYPTHCIQGSWGAELHSDVLQVDGAKYVQKGVEVFVDAYSGFLGHDNSELEIFLREGDIRAAFICGLSLDICVTATARDSARLGFLTAVIVDCSKGLCDEQIQHCMDELRARNVAVLDSSAVNAFIDKRKIPWRWICQLAGIDSFEGAPKPMEYRRQKSRKSLETDAEPTAQQNGNHVQAAISV
ncbi:CBN-PNC-2 protein [Aphelenchoides avenae]|nr:CBN-PNC-2 protein [Aphelenchus avenae]